MDIKFTYDDYRALPETGPRYQLVEGELLMTPAYLYVSSARRSRIASEGVRGAPVQRVSHWIGDPVLLHRSCPASLST